MAHCYKMDALGNCVECGAGGPSIGLDPACDTCGPDATAYVPERDEDDGVCYFGGKMCDKCSGAVVVLCTLDHATETFEDADGNPCPF